MSASLQVIQAEGARAARRNTEFFPYPVGKTTNTSFLFTNSVTISSCSGFSEG